MSANNLPLAAPCTGSNTTDIDDHTRLVCVWPRVRVLSGRGYWYYHPRCVMAQWPRRDTGNRNLTRKHRRTLGCNHYAINGSLSCRVWLSTQWRHRSIWSRTMLSTTQATQHNGAVLSVISACIYMSYLFHDNIHHHFDCSPINDSSPFLLSCRSVRPLTLYRMVMPIGTPFLKEKINN